MPNPNDGKLEPLTYKNSALCLRTGGYDVSGVAGVIERSPGYSVLCCKGRKHPERPGRVPDHQPAEEIIRRDPEAHRCAQPALEIFVRKNPVALFSLFAVLDKLMGADAPLPP